MNRKLFLSGILFGMVAIILGAFAAHGLKPKISPEAMATFETGVRYQMYSAFFLLVLGLMPMVPEKAKNICFYLTIVGVFLFSGSIYLLATNDLTAFDFKRIALATPLGGTLMIAAWIVLFLRFLKLKIK